MPFDPTDVINTTAVSAQVGNIKTFMDAPAYLLNNLLSNQQSVIHTLQLDSADHRRRTNVHAETLMVVGGDRLYNADPFESKAVQAIDPALLQIMSKMANTTPPVTGT